MVGKHLTKKRIELVPIAYKTYNNGDTTEHVVNNMALIPRRMTNPLLDNMLRTIEKSNLIQLTN